MTTKPLNSWSLAMDGVEKKALKPVKPREELARMIMEEALKSGACNDLKNVFVLGPVTREGVNWSFGTRRQGTSSLSKACSDRLNEIGGRIQERFNLQDE